MANLEVNEYDGPVKLRSYQQEMLEVSLKRNVIVAMDTGSGKTHIAIARIRAELERSKSDKLVWFMTPGRALSDQQCRLLQGDLPSYHIRSLTGADNVDKWTEQRLWDAFLSGVDVVVGTPAVLLDALTHGFVTMSRLSLCVFDEVHRCTKGHPMNKIMKDFYHPAKAHGMLVPHILGLSASPVMSVKATSLDIIERNMDATTVTPKRFRTELDRHVHRPQMLKTLYADDISSSTKLHAAPTYAALVMEMRRYDFDNDPYVAELRERSDSNAQRLLSKVISSGKTYCVDQLKAVITRATALEEQLGGSMAEWYTCACLQRFLTSQNDMDTLLPELSEREKEHLARLFERALTHEPTGNASIADLSSISNKALALRSALLDNSKPGFRGIVFVQQRAAVTALAHMLRSLPEITKSYNVGTFVGTSVSSHRKGSIADLVNLREQAKDLEDFRDGTKNLMIATDVLEEGIDIPACNGVLCFDLPKNLVSFVQRRGRARQADSKYLLFISETDMKTDPARWQKLEDQMKEAYMDDSREVATAPVAEDEQQMALIKFLVPATGALLTLDNAKAHLHHFCAVSTRDESRYIDPRPEFDAKQNADTALWTATVTLPAFIHSSIRSAISSMSWNSGDVAIKDAAFVAYTALHKAGLVNDNLLPPFREIRAEPDKDHIDQPSLVQASLSRSSWQAVAKASQQEGTTWYATAVTLTLDSRVVLEEILWLPLMVPHVDSFKLYWNAAIVYNARFQLLVHTVSATQTDKVQLMSETTKLMLSQVFGDYMPSELSDFAFLTTPPEQKGAQDWLSSRQGSQNAIQYFNEHESYESCGLVHVAGQHGRHYVLQEAKQADSTPGDNADCMPPETELLLTPFPKRRNFLHAPIDHGDANLMHTAKQAFPVSQCTVDRLEARHALFAAFLPSILHKIDIALLVQDLQCSVLAPVDIKQTTGIIEAISAPSLGAQTDYNRLEYLGDTLLKFCTELNVMAKHPIAPEAYLSVEKDRIVRNSNLAQAALDAGLDQYILTKPFTGAKWRPPYLSEVLMDVDDGKREMSSKILADVVEALVGAAFVDGGLQKAYDCIRTLLPKEGWLDFEQAFEDLHAELGDHHLAGLEPLEELLGHCFINQSLLVEAITHASLTQNIMGMSYERLEFLGDAVLDLIVTPKLFAHPRKLRHWELHRTHQALVNAHFLGFCCMSILGKEGKFDIVSTGSARSSRMELSKDHREYYLHDFLRASGELVKAKRVSVTRFQELREPIASSLENGGYYPWPDLIAMHPDKFISDMIESILGALYIDTRGDLKVCEAFVERLGILPTMRRLLDDGVETAFPKERLGILADRQGVEYVTTRKEDEHSKRRIWNCAVKVGGEVVEEVIGCGSKEEAEVRGAEMAAAKLTQASIEHGQQRKRKLHVKPVELRSGAQDIVGTDR